MSWPEPDFFRINVVAQDGALVGFGLDSDGSVAVHTVECGTVVVAYERYARCVVGELCRVCLYNSICGDYPREPADQ